MFDQLEEALGAQQLYFIIKIQLFVYSSLISTCSLVYCFVTTHFSNIPICIYFWLPKQILNIYYVSIEGSNDLPGTFAEQV